MTAAMPRGIRNNNPTNIERGPNAWKGIAEQQPDERFATFVAAKWGIRAAARVLQTYQERHGLRTIRELVSRWAPSSDGNNPAAYVAQIELLTDIEGDAPIDVTDYATALALIKAMTRVENGKAPPDRPPAWYPDETFEQGLRLAGVSPSKAPTDSRTHQGTAVAASATAVAGTTLLAQMLGLSPEVAALLPDALDGLTAQQIAWAVLFVALAGNVRAFLAREDDRKRGRL